MKIGYRTLKTAIGTPLAIWIAQLAQLDSFTSAGILAILCIQVTRKRSVLSAWHRFGACLLAMLFSYVIFELIGYHPIAIGLMLILFIPATVKFKLTQGIVTSSVIILHLYSSNHITVDIVLNELGLITVGIGTALLLNLYMPSVENKLHRMQDRVEDNFCTILKEIATYLRDGNQIWTGKELSETEELLDNARRLVARDIENHLLRGHHPYYDYFQMRTKQFELLERMLPLVSQIPETYEQSYKMADFFEELAASVHPGNTAVVFLRQIKEMKHDFEEDDLPKTRKEFETRANLYRLLHEIEQYLILKKAFKQSDVNEKQPKGASYS